VRAHHVSGETERPGQRAPQGTSRERWAQQQMFAASSGQRRTLASTRERYSYVSKHTGHHSERSVRYSRRGLGGVEEPTVGKSTEHPTEAAAAERGRAGVLGGRLEESRTEAVRQLQQALSARSPHVALWLETCERLKASAAAELVERVLATSPPGDGLFTAIDAARVVIRPSTQPGQAWRVAEPPKEARSTRADLLILLGWLAPLAPLEEMIELLHGLYAQNESVVRVGAIDAVQIIGTEHPEVFRLLVDKPQGPRLLQATMASRQPVERARMHEGRHE
jgi:hypothetical protein